MSLNNSYGNYNNPMMGGMGMMGMSSNIAGVTNGNVWLSYQNKYGCEDCFMHEPHWREYHGAILHTCEDETKPTLWQRIKMRIFG